MRVRSITLTQLLYPTTSILFDRFLVRSRAAVSENQVSPLHGLVSGDSSVMWLIVRLLLGGIPKTRVLGKLGGKNSPCFEVYQEFLPSIVALGENHLADGHVADEKTPRPSMTSPWTWSQPNTVSSHFNDMFCQHQDCREVQNQQFGAAATIDVLIAWGKQETNFLLEKVGLFPGCVMTSLDTITHTFSPSLRLTLTWLSSFLCWQKPRTTSSAFKHWLCLG